MPAEHEILPSTRQPSQDAQHKDLPVWELVVSQGNGWLQQYARSLRPKDRSQKGHLQNKQPCASVIKPMSP